MIVVATNEEYILAQKRFKGREIVRTGVGGINVLNASISITLGFVSLISFDIFFIQKKHKLDEIVKILLIAYTISLVIGVIQYIAIKFNLDWLKYLFIMIGKRSYIRNNRVQFTFTEPSFIGMHLFGVLLPIYLKTEDNRLLKLIIVFSMTSILFASGVRVLLDVVVVLVIMIVIKNIKNSKIIFSIIVLIPIILISINWAYNNNYRVKAIIDDGIYADGSLASRYFRINASIKGYKKSLYHTLFGYGIGNAILPIRI